MYGCSRDPLVGGGSEVLLSELWEEDVLRGDAPDGRRGVVLLLADLLKSAGNTMMVTAH
jgi:hypothetical protein